MGKNAYTALSHIETPVDLVVVATPMETVPEIIADCRRIKTAGAVVISAGGKETGERGRQHEARIRQAAAGSEVRIIGPNCLGIMCTSARLNATFAARMPLEGKLAFISQSGAICAAILDYSVKEHIGFSHFISLGSMLDVDFGDIIDYLGGDPKVSSIIMYVENLTHHRSFMSAARAVSRVNAAIALKAGGSRAGAIAAASHTGAMAGEDAVTMRRSNGPASFGSKPSKNFSMRPRFSPARAVPVGPDLSILTNAGGPGVMAADALAD